MLSTSSHAAFAAYHRERSLAPPEAPFPANLARDAEGRPVLLVPRDELASWHGWSAAGEAHVLSPIDIVRTPEGHEVVLPFLSETLDGFLRRRLDAAAPPSPGEIVTLCASIVRGTCSSLEREGSDAGEWWLDESGRPVLVEGVGAERVVEAGARILECIADAVARTRLAAVVRSGREIIELHSPEDAAAEWEERLFACADPEPLATEVLGPRRARRLATTTRAESPAPDPLQDESSPDGAPRPLWQRLARAMDADLATAASDAVSAALQRSRRLLRRRKPTAAPQRKRAFAWAALCAGLVVGGGLLWPSSDAPTGVSETFQEETAHSEGTQEPPSPLAEAEPGDDTRDAAADLAAQASELLLRRSGCADEACLSGVLENPAQDVPAGIVDAPEGQRRVTLLDDLGGVAVLRIDGEGSGAPAQLLTIVDTTDGWRIRDAYVVADTPP